MLIQIGGQIKKLENISTHCFVDGAIGLVGRWAHDRDGTLSNTNSNTNPLPSSLELHQAAQICMAGTDPRSSIGWLIPYNGKGEKSLTVSCMATPPTLLWIQFRPVGLLVPLQDRMKLTVPEG